MGVPATSGQLRTSLDDMQIGDYINESPTLVVSSPVKAVYGDLVFKATIQDVENYPAKYRILLNGEVVENWTSLLPTPISINETLSASSFVSGNNTLTVEYEGYYGVTGAWSTTFVKKTVDSVYMTSSQKYPYDDKLKVDVSNIAYIKIADPVRPRGYIREATLNLDVLSNGGESGSIKIAPIKSGWNSANISPTSPPAIETSKAITVNITNTAGVTTVDITDVAEYIWGMLTGYGIAVYTTTHSVEFNVTGISVDYTEQPTVLTLPPQVFGNRVELTWKPVIIEKLAAFKKFVVKRDTSPTFTSAVIVFETPDKNVLSCVDDTVSEGDYYYRVEVEMEQYAYNGNQLDFDLEDASKFTQQNEVNGTVFVGGVVKLHSIPALASTEDCDSDTGFVYDNTKIEIIDGVIRLKNIFV